MIFSWFAMALIYGQVEFTDSNLPIIVINSNGQKIVDDPKVTCDMGIIWNGQGHRNFIDDDFNDYDGKIGIEIRGSTSQKYPKKSYGLETRDSCGNNLNISLLGLPEENDWVLYGIYSDKSLMRNAITYSLYGDMQPWSPKFVYCELVIDGEYMGLYMLIEKIKRDKHRLDIAEIEMDDISGDKLTGGYVIKIDKPTGSSSISWSSKHQKKLEFLYHDPKREELNEIQRNYIENYIADFEKAVYSRNFQDPDSGYRAYINVGSFIDFMIMQEFAKTVDGYRSSSFMYKDRNKKLACGPVWDFNLSYGNADYCGGFNPEGWQYEFADVCGLFYSSQPPNWWKRLLEDPYFTNELKCRWQYLRSDLLSIDHIYNMIDATGLQLAEAKDRNFKKWTVLDEYVNWNYFIGETYDEEIGYLKWWIQERVDFLDENLPGTCDDSWTYSTD
ncbi:CotH kinase family protein [Portibacter marinus]|uniref:CotH kinase family protein n=1 Tax=Portibacter marinus TaxID=2898660 RepID=UPI001F3DC77D|nr:CotH kinase family protein [Portibacter marinus]